MVACASSAPAHAATQLGAVSNADQNCDANTTTVQAASQDGGPSYRVPEGGGVITSWGFATRGNPGVRRLKLLVPNAGTGAYDVTAESAAEAAAPNRRNVFPSRIAVTGREQIAVFSTTGEGCAGSTEGSNFVASGPGDPPAGSSFTITTIGPGGLFAASLLEVIVNLEPDADRDGYGDETQDGCPTDATIFATGCGADLEASLTASRGSVRLGDEITYTLSARNLGPARADGVTVSHKLPTGAGLVSATQGCTGFETITCTVRTMEPGASTPVYKVVVRAPSVGALESTATASARLKDPVGANNTASAVVSVGPPRFAGPRLGGGAVRARRGRVPVRISCPVAVRSCTGRLALATASRVRTRPGAKGRTLALGSIAFKLRQGRSTTLRVRLPKAALRHLNAAGKVRTRLSARSIDGFSQPATRTGTLTVLSERRGRR